MSTKPAASPLSAVRAPHDIPRYASQDGFVIGVLVTGATGFIGRHVTAALLGADVRVRVLCRGSGGARVDSGAEVAISGDIGDRRALRAALKGIDCVVHLAGVAHRTTRAKGHLVEMRRVNVGGTRILAKEAVSSGVSRFVFLSSIAAVCSSSDDVVNESTSPMPVTPYGLAKLEAERGLTEAAGADMTVTVLRPPMVYGPGMRGNPLLLFRAIRAGIPLPFGSVRNRRSSIYVVNLADIVRLIVTSEPAYNDTFCVADEEAVSTLEFTRRCAASLAIIPRIVSVPPGLLSKMTRLTEFVPAARNRGLTRRNVEVFTRSLVVSSRHFSEATHFVPRWDMCRALDATARWFHQSSGGHV